MARTAQMHRATSESDITCWVDLDGTGSHEISTGVGFYDHMLTALSKHSLIDMRIKAEGDLHIDGHHTIEDTAIVLGQCLDGALGDRAGIRRFGDALVPLDESLAQAVVDVSGRPYFVGTGEPEGQIYARIGGTGAPYSGSMTYHLMESLALHARMCLHLRLLAGRDPHHIVESQFKAVAQALRTAVALDSRIEGMIPSTKGAL
jgi:imidazoleglycerol-phosphate dehydratase